MIDTRELGRRPGSMRKFSRTVPAPADLGLDMIGVPEGSELELDLRLEAVMEGVLVSGTARVHLAGECVRCLDEIERMLDVDFQELYFYPEEAQPEDEEEALRLEGELLDLEPTLRDAVVLALPLQPVCQDDCPGLCVVCGARLADVRDHHHDEAVDPRWAALRKYRDAVADSGADQED
ncbi:metal-binding protein [Carbonactinospora thermoautotrophica]|uniref:Metal-binding protein n=1 Tax=Carbonactinospora thermoautotrophica TaxID=1469144 RepID=A0A132N1L6_9ACTN|nr:metal-binding protein [Carbonactinospora thermoautotrophica]